MRGMAHKHSGKNRFDKYNVFCACPCSESQTNERLAAINRDLQNEKTLKPRKGPSRWKIGPPLLPGAKDLGDSLVKAGSAGSTTAVKRGGTDRFALLCCGLVERGCKVEDALPPNVGLFVVVLDIDVDHVHRAVERRTSVEKIIDDGIPTTLLASEHYVHKASLSADVAAIFRVLQARHANGPVLPSLGTPLDLSVPVEHIENAVVLVKP